VREALKLDTNGKDADFNRGMKEADIDFEQRFLDYAYKTTARIDALSVAHNCKVSIKDAGERLEDLAAREVLIREVDDEGQVYFRLPGRGRQGALVQTQAGPLAKAGDEGTAVVGLLVNLALPGVGSLIAGRTREGVFQLVMLAVGLPLMLIFIGIPLVIGAWVWALVTGINAVNTAKGSNLQN
jgi:TM2 domain-containing membrane protein YozV